VLKADFTAMVAHELGSPLAAIRGFCDMLDTGALNPAEQTQAVAAIRTEAEALTALVSDVRNAANVERADFTIDRRPVAINALLNEAATFATTLPGHHTLTLQCIDDVQVCVDRERIGQVLRNLLSNAAKYSHPGAPIELRAWMRPGVVRIEVTDHGPGIHPEDRARIFEKFGRGRDCTGRNVAGVGLGLYLSRRIVQAHGSALEVTSTVDVGSVFAFELEVVS
jgi:signal transduction histidine kinase